MESDKEMLRLRETMRKTGGGRGSGERERGREREGEREGRRGREGEHIPVITYFLQLSCIHTPSQML